LREAERRASPRRHRLLAPVVVEAALRLAAEPAGLDPDRMRRATVSAMGRGLRRSPATLAIFRAALTTASPPHEAAIRVFETAPPEAESW